MVFVTAEEVSDAHAVVRFAVADAGVEITPDRIDRLFKSLSQVDASTTRKYGGTGLGLAISKQLAELMGNQIGVDSEVGRGSTFWFTARLERIAGAEGREWLSPVDPSGLRVLAVDDNPQHAAILRQQIESRGLEAETAAAGSEALAKLTAAVEKGCAFRVAIVDHDLPEMSGIELGRVMKARPLLRDTVLVILITMDQLVDLATRRRCGFSGQITKPMRESQLFDTIISAAVSAANNSPLELQPPREAVPRMGAVPAAAGRILVAEDNDAHQFVVGEILTKAGYPFDIVGDGMTAVAAADRLKALPSPPRVVILSDREEHSYRELAVAVRADAYVLKRHFATVVPFVLKDLRNRTTTAEAGAEQGTRQSPGAGRARWAGSAARRAFFTSPWRQAARPASGPAPR